jgi:hypothetical protein
VGNRPVNFSDPSGNLYCGLGLLCGADVPNGGSPLPANPSTPTPQPYKSGKLYFRMQITTNADIQSNTLEHKAEESYSNFGDGLQLSPILTNPEYAIDFAHNMVGFGSDFSMNAGYYPISVKVNWSQSNSGILIHDIEVKNNSPTIAYIANVTFSSVFHKPNIPHPGDARYFGSPENSADSNGTLNMNVGAVVPNYQDIMSVQIKTSGGFPEAPYLSFSLKNLPPGCSSPLWLR